MHPAQWEPFCFVISLAAQVGLPLIIVGKSWNEQQRGNNPSRRSPDETSEICI
ncbi:hypothetical protein [Schlesneria sp. T3-172]|uniref:hypothetical protein n=1 Tax=Schlesneria sphaerica TaxID=3373610 RepID=UPI0037CBCCF9